MAGLRQAFHGVSSSPVSTYIIEDGHEERLDSRRTRLQDISRARLYVDGYVGALRADPVDSQGT
jgi:hypothetical protein